MTTAETPSPSPAAALLEGVRFEDTPDCPPGQWSSIEFCGGEAGFVQQLTPEENLKPWQRRLVVGILATGSTLQAQEELVKRGIVAAGDKWRIAKQAATVNAILGIDPVSPNGRTPTGLLWGAVELGHMKVTPSADPSPFREIIATATTEFRRKHEESLEQLLTLYAQGLTLGAMREALGISRTPIKEVIKAMKQETGLAIIGQQSGVQLATAMILSGEVKLPDSTSGSDKPSPSGLRAGVRTRRR